MNSFFQCYVMLVFGVKYRRRQILPQWCDELYAMMANTLNNFDGIHTLKIGGYADHVHILISTTGKMALRDVIRNIKSFSSRWINENGLCQGGFEWQSGAGYFSYSQGELTAVKNYIENQWEHHKHVTFREEYEKWLTRSGYPFTRFDLPQEMIED